MPGIFFKLVAACVFGASVEERHRQGLSGMDGGLAEQTT